MTTPKLYWSLKDHPDYPGLTFECDDFSPTVLVKDESGEVITRITPEVFRKLWLEACDLQDEAA